MSRVSPKFKPGDKVRCIDNSGAFGEEFSLDKIYTVETCYSVAVSIKGSRKTLYSDRFVLAYQDKHAILKQYLETQEGDISEIIKLFTNPTA